MLLFLVLFPHNHKKVTPLRSLSLLATFSFTSFPSSFFPYSCVSSLVSSSSFSLPLLYSSLLLLTDFLWSLCLCSFPLFTWFSASLSPSVPSSYLLCFPLPSPNIFFVPSPCPLCVERPLFVHSVLHVFLFFCSFPLSTLSQLSSLLQFPRIEHIPLPISRSSSLPSLLVSHPSFTPQREPHHFKLLLQTPSPLIPCPLLPKPSAPCLALSLPLSSLLRSLSPK